MARVLLATYMVRYPLGGMLSWALQYALGLQRLGHDVYLLERANYENACFNPNHRTLDDDFRPGHDRVRELLKRFGLDDKLLFETVDGQLFGADKNTLNDLFGGADVLIDGGNHGAWLEEADAAGLPTVLIDGEPGFRQMKMVKARANGKILPHFDVYFSNGANIGTAESSAPDAGKTWHHVFNPVDTQSYTFALPPKSGCFTTVMNWQSHAPMHFEGRTFGQKDIEFTRFEDLPRLTSVPLEVAAAGQVPKERLKTKGWRLRDGHEVTDTYDAYRTYIENSLGEFSICKNVFIATRSGWFSDRSAAYLATGRPVVLQDTGFSSHLPCGEGLFAVSSVEQAAAALDEIMSDYPRQARAARELAESYLDARLLMARVLAAVGL